METTSKPRPSATPIWAGSNVTKRTGAGSRSAAARWIASVSRTGCVRARPAARSRQRWSSGHDVEVIPREADRVLEVGAQDRLVGEPVDRRQRLGERQRRGAPDRVAVERVEHDRRAAGRRRRAPAVRWCRGRRVIRGAPAAPGRGGRPTRSATGAGGRHALGAARRRRATRTPGAGRVAGALSSSGPSWATGRPPVVTIVRSPVAARRTAPASSAAGRGRRSSSDLCAHVYTSRFAAPRQARSHSGHELRLHRRTRRAAQDRPRLPRGQERRDRRPRADGDRGRLRRGRVEPDGRADGPAGPAHPRGVRRLGLRLRRARHRARGDGSGAAVRAVLLVGRARRQHADPVRRRRRQADVPAGHRQRRDDRHARLHRAVRQVGRGGHHDAGDRLGRRLHAHRHEDVRDRRPHRQPDHRRRPHGRRRQPVRRRRRRVRARPARRCRRWTRPASRPSSSSTTRRPR